MKAFTQFYNSLLRILALSNMHDFFSKAMCYIFTPVDSRCYAFVTPKPINAFFTT